MKLLVCATLIVLGINALTDDQKARLATISKECRAESGASQELIEKARAGDLVDDPKLKKQMLCVSKKVNLATADGQLNIDVLKKKLKKVAADDVEVDNIVKKCAVKKDTQEETAFQIFRCLQKEKPNFSPID